MINYQSENLLYKVLDGKVESRINGSLVYIKKPKFDDFIQANFLYNLEYGRALEDGAFTENGMMDFLRLHQMWSDEEEKEYTGIDKTIEELKVDLYNSFLQFKGRDKTRKQLDRAKSRRIELIIKRSAMESWTAEYIAGTIRMSYLIWSSSYCGGKRYFRKEFADSDYWAVSILLTSYNKSLLGDEKVRGLCKLPKWRILWSLSKSIKGIFRKSITQLTDNQLSLISWSRFYDNVNKSMECPPNDVIEDDDMLDGWAIVSARKREEEKNKGAAEQLVPDIHKNADEVFMITDNDRDAARINSLNDQYGRMIQRQKLTQTQKHGQISDFQMPSVKQELQMQINNMKRPQG